MWKPTFAFAIKSSRFAALSILLAAHNRYAISKSCQCGIGRCGFLLEADFGNLWTPPVAFGRTVNAITLSFTADIQTTSLYIERTLTYGLRTRRCSGAVYCSNN